MHSAGVLAHGRSVLAFSKKEEVLCKTTLCFLCVGVSESAVVLRLVGIRAPVIGILVSWSREEDVLVVDSVGKIFDGIVSSSGDVVAARSAVLKVRVAAVVADGLSSLTTLEVSLDGTESSIAPALSFTLSVSGLAVGIHPGELAPLVVDDVSAGLVVYPGAVVSASSGADFCLASNWNVCAIDGRGIILMESSSHLDLVVLPLLSEAGERLLATHLDSDFG